ncbi:MAG: hypothetical protein IH595_03940 [Bacteroidales bacterium]|nr:hypothetical protein [Bacteroidales bacterium]
MTHSDSISQLETTLETLQSLTEKMKESSGIHQLDIDLLQQKTRELYEQILALQPVSFESVGDKNEMTAPLENKPEFETEQQVEIEQETEMTAEQQPVVENIQVEEKSEEEFIIDEVVEPEAEPASEVFPVEVEKEEVVEESEENHEEVYEDVVMEKVSQEPPQAKPNESVIMQQKTTFDLFTDSQENTLATVLQKSNRTNLGEKLEHSHIGDLREAIGINDKFQFINELFNGDMDQYNKVLDELNNFSNLQGALTYLSELSVQYDFQKTGMAFQKLKAMLDKKYA